MNVLENLNEALDYIDQNLENEIDEQEIAKRAYCSVFHFKRMFSYLAGIPLQEYIRRRRLTLAAFDLQDRTVKVIDIAIKYGYNSPDVFTRAFQGLHGITPTEARNTSHSLQAFPPMTFRLSIGGSEPIGESIIVVVFLIGLFYMRFVMEWRLSAYQDVILVIAILHAFRSVIERRLNKDSKQYLLSAYTSVSGFLFFLGVELFV